MMHMAKLNGKRVRHRIAELDLTSDAVAKATGIPPGTFRNVVAGASISLRRVYKISTALCLPVDEVMDSGEASGDGVPDNPPKQPKGPTGRPQRKDTEEKKTGPKRHNAASAA